MAVYSMTGYGHCSAAVAAGPDTIELDIRSVNSRFLDLTFKLADELRPHETALREAVSSSLKRGKVEVRAHVVRPAGAGLREPSQASLAVLARLEAAVLRQLPAATTLSVADVLRMTLSETNAAEGPLDYSAALLLATRSGLEGLRESRGREGAKLAVMLQERTAGLRELASRAAPLIPELVELQRQRFIEKFNQAAQSLDASVNPASLQDRALSEATAYAIRIDVAEELNRLGAHIDEIDQLLAKGGELGKRLDFVIQELLREANTLGSKASSLALTRISVDMKVLIEQMREQVQNIE
jgi:uncharacterized protein (TIGR00255 family)